MIECYQNIIFHAIYKEGKIGICQSGNSFCIKASNDTSLEKSDKLKSALQLIAQANSSQIKEIYTSRLLGMKPDQGAGLGLLYISKKADDFKYSLHQLHLELEIRVNKPHSLS